MARLNAAQEKALINWAVAATGLTAIWDKQKAKRPMLPYVTLGFTGGPRREGKPEMLYKQLDVYYYNVRYVITVTANVIAETDHIATMDLLQSSLVTDTALAALRQAGLAFRSNEPPVDISDVVDTGYEFGAAADFFFAFATTVEDTTGEIRRVVMEGTLGSVTRELDITNP